MPGIHFKASTVSSTALSFTTKTILSSNQSSILAKVKRAPVSNTYHAMEETSFEFPPETMNEVMNFDILDGQLQTNKRRAQFTVYALERLLGGIEHHHSSAVAMMNDAAHYKLLNRRESFIAHLRRMYQITEVPLYIIVNALHYLMRVQESDMSPYRHISRNLYVNDGETLSGMFTTSLIIANHFCEDHAYSNQTWSKVSGASCDDINASQRQFLALLNYRLHITVGEYQSLTNHLLDIYNQWSDPLMVISGGNNTSKCTSNTLVSIPLMRADINLNNNFNNITARCSGGIDRSAVHIIAAKAQITNDDRDDDLMSISDDYEEDDDFIESEFDSDMQDE